MNTRGLAQLAYEKGMHVITASQSYQSAPGIRRLGYGYLTYAMIEEGLKRGLADAQPRDGNVLLKEWFDYSAGSVPDLFREEQKSRGLRERRLLVHDARAGESPDVQQPRVFYRREQEALPLVIARPNYLRLGP